MSPRSRLAKLLTPKPSCSTLEKTMLKDENARNADFWIYNDLAAARAEAKRANKPLFVTFRCVPCADSRRSCD